MSCGTCSEETKRKAAAASGSPVATGAATTRLSSPKSGTNRAKAGGEIGVNGERYEGGQFLPSTTLPKQAPTSRKAGTGKREIAPYVWEVAPEGKQSIYSRFSHLWQITDGKAAVIDNAQALAYYKRSAEEVQAAADQWNAGERWMP
jgi:hypothetical protein